MDDGGVSKISSRRYVGRGVGNGMVGRGDGVSESFGGMSRGIAILSESDVRRWKSSWESSLGVGHILHLAVHLLVVILVGLEGEVDDLGGCSGESVGGTGEFDLLESTEKSFFA